MVDQEEAILVEVRVGIECKSLALVGTQMAELVVGILVVERKEREVENKYFGLVGYKDLIILVAVGVHRKSIPNVITVLIVLVRW